MKKMEIQKKVENMEPLGESESNSEETDENMRQDPRLKKEHDRRFKLKSSKELRNIPKSERKFYTVYSDSSDFVEKRNRGWHAESATSRSFSEGEEDGKPTEPYSPSRMDYEYWFLT